MAYTFDIDEAQKYMLFMLRNKENISSLLTGLLKPLADTTSDLVDWSDQNGVLDATGDSLTRLAELFDVQRLGRNDDTLRRFLRARLIELKNGGTFGDLKQVFEVLLPLVSWDIEDQNQYREDGIVAGAQILIKILDQIDIGANDVISVLRRIKALGVDWRLDLPPDDFDQVLTVSDGEIVETGNGSNDLGNGTLIPHQQI